MIKNDATNKLELNIQLFADTAENDSDVKETLAPVNADNAGSEEVTFVDGSPTQKTTEEPIKTVETDETSEKNKTTKAFSERLKREKQKIEQEAEVKRIAELDKIAKARGFEDWNEMNAYTKNEQLETLGIKDANAFNAYVDEVISNNPVVKEAKRVLETQKEREQEALLTQAVTEINKVDSDIKSINDLIALENYDEFYGLVEKGYSLPDAYKIIAFDKIASKKAASAAQNVITNINNKGHLKTSKGTTTNEVVVPEDILAGYKKNMPGMTDQEIREHYTKFVGGLK